MLTDISPSVSVAGQFYGSQIQSMGITNIAQHIQKPVSKVYFLFYWNFFETISGVAMSRHLWNIAWYKLWRWWIKEGKKGSESNDLFNNKERKNIIWVSTDEKPGIFEIWCQFLFLSSLKCQSPADLLWSIKISWSGFCLQSFFAVWRLMSKKKIEKLKI